MQHIIENSKNRLRHFEYNLFASEKIRIFAAYPLCGRFLLRVKCGKPIRKGQMKRIMIVIFVSKARCLRQLLAVKRDTPRIGLGSRFQPDIAIFAGVSAHHDRPRLGRPLEGRLQIAIDFGKRGIRRQKRGPPGRTAINLAAEFQYGHVKRFIGQKSITVCKAGRAESLAHFFGQPIYGKPVFANEANDRIARIRLGLPVGIELEACFVWHAYILLAPEKVSDCY
nr:hypothetical protein [Saccharibacillus brassicae]